MVTITEGIFEGTFLDDPSYAELNEKLEEPAGCYGVSKACIAYAWLLRLPLSIQVVVGTTKSERIVDAARAKDVKLSRMQWYDLYKAAGNQLP